LREPARATARRRRVLAEIREGSAFVFGHRLLRPVFVTQFVFNIALFALQAVYVPYAVHHLGASAAAVGLTLATYGVGMVVGALLATRLLRALPFGVVVALGPLAGLAAAIVMVATIWTPSVVLAGASFFLVGVGPIVWVISTATLRQSLTPETLLGRVSAIYTTAWGARPLGAIIGAVVGGVFGAPTCLVVAALGFLAQAVVIVASPVARLTRQPEMVR
jgi:predicted MFS family arabinose efflux permease